MFKIYIYLLFVTGKMWLEISTNKKFVYSGNIFPKMPIMKQCQKDPQKITKIKTFVTLQGNIQFQGTAYISEASELSDLSEIFTI